MRSQDSREQWRFEKCNEQSDVSDERGLVLKDHPIWLWHIWKTPANVITFGSSRADSHSSSSTLARRSLSACSPIRGIRERKMAPGRTRIRPGAPAGASAEFLPSLRQLCGGPSTRLATLNNFGDNHQLQSHVFDSLERNHLHQILASNPSRPSQSSSELPPESRQQFVQAGRGLIEYIDQDTRVAPIFDIWRVDHEADDDRKHFARDALHAIDPVSAIYHIACGHPHPCLQRAVRCDAGRGKSGTMDRDCDCRPWLGRRARNLSH